MSEAIAVSDASPLIVFHQIERIELVNAVLGNVLIPSAVASEIAPSLGAPPEWVHVMHHAQARAPEPWWSSLDPGEIAAISLAVDVSADRILIDDLPARRMAEHLGLQVVGSLGILLEAYRMRLLEDVRPVLDAMIEVRFHVGRSLYEEILGIARDIDLRRRE
jgi:predicted nucleic acid-binding protein